MLNYLGFGPFIFRMPDGTVVARAGNRTRELCDPTAHAEVLAIRAACAALGSERLVGHALLFPLAQAQFGSRGMDLHHLFVAEDCRGQGVGRALIDGVLDLATRLGCAYVAVGTQGENARAVAVYDAAGFVLRAPGGLRLVKRL